MDSGYLVAGDINSLNLLVFTVFLKNRNISSKIKRSNVTDYAALRVNTCVFIVYTVRIFMKCTHVCMAQKAN